MDECKPLPSATCTMVTAIMAFRQARDMGGSRALPRCVAHAAVTAVSQGPTLVHVRAQLEQLQDKFMSQFGL